MFLRVTAAHGEQQPFGHYVVVRAEDGQAVGGIGAGILFPISLSMIAAITPDHRARAKVRRALETYLEGDST